MKCGLMVKIIHLCGICMEHHSSTGSVNLNTELQLKFHFQACLLRLFLLNKSKLLNLSLHILRGFHGMFVE